MHQRKRSEADWAVEILLEKQEPVYYLDLVKEISKRMGRSQDDYSLTSIYTRLNLDNRLVHQGDGYWFYDTNRIRPEE
ncbi:MAG TPA: DNA-directed RNA polymerase subunit delta [Syntrophomonadaceae bacterium]|nr:DNA-directed RNA polymerase subunit delta [Syntrophomonadaceae bacterium]HQA06614.1 DNA-directed RNA polymerase subunit delta [Syntrophomonadaceae bacterium]HQE22313.1 DNA-directed RNA polymerase subunit delta [Syntrophomonadaceae bacterium]